MSCCCKRSLAGLFTLIVLSQSPLFAAAPKTVGAYYTGSVGESLPVQMSLVSKDGAIAGSYFYERSGNPLSLNGKRDKSFYAKIDEHTSTYRKSGLFEGTLDLSANAFSGTWSSPDGKKSLPFTLDKTATYFRVQSTSRLTTASADYPVFRKTSPALKKISETIRAELIERNENFVKENALEPKNPERTGSAFDYILDQSAGISYFSDDLISVEFSTYCYQGGVHGNTESTTRNWWIRGSIASTINLDDLFLAESGWRAKLSAACIRELKKKDADDVVDGRIKSFNAESLKNFTLSPTGINLQFSQQLSNSSFEAKISYKELAAQIDPRGPLGRFVR